MLARSYAKVNLWLRVVGKRPDGFHDIETIFQTVSLFDELEFDAGHPSIEVSMSVPVEDNLAERAARALTRERNLGARVTIRKHIPVGAGLAGGSGNAAAVLRALDLLWELRTPGDELVDLAAGLGSDVPFLLEGGTKLGWGRGELLARLPYEPDLWFVLGISNEGLSTAEVYRRWDPLGPAGRVGGAPVETESNLGEFRDALASGDPDLIAARVRNDLQAAALDARPELADKLEGLIAVGALAAFVSGSGPTVVGIGRDEEHARTLAGSVEEHFDRVEVVSTHPRAVELGP
jgi:4-diphosphocytidyl-2-C-methyl-D-erythritol kinase